MNHSPKFVPLLSSGTSREITAVYVLWNHATDLKYVGATSNLRRRMIQHANGHVSNTRLRDDMNRYGANNFSVMAYPLPHMDVAYKIERRLIERLQTRDPQKGYNIAAGGKGGSWGISPSQETRELHRRNSSAFRHTEESKAHMREIQRSIRRVGKDSPWYGRKHKPESIEKIRQARLGTKHSQETKDKMTKTRTGRKATPETRERQRQAALAVWKRRRDNASNS